MRRFCTLGFLAIALSSCGLPAPYQTYAPDQTAAPLPAPVSPIIVYGATTTTPDMVPDAPVIAPVPVPPAPTTAPASNRVAICFNRIWTRSDAVKSAAVQACGGTPSPQITSQGIDIAACPLLIPTKAVFACSAPSKTP